MIGIMVVFGGMLVLGVITASHMSAGHANTQMNPVVPYSQAVFTALGAGGNRVYPVQV
jgi:hypothetical protein